MNFINQLITKINQFSNKKKKILRLKIFKTTNSFILNKILYLLYFYGYIKDYFFFKLEINNSIIFVATILLNTKINYSFYNFISYKDKISLKKYTNNHFLNSYNTLLIKKLNNIILYPYTKTIDGKLFIKIK